MIISPPLDFIRLPRTLTIFGVEYIFPARALAHPARHALRPRQPPLAADHRVSERSDRSVAQEGGKEASAPRR